MLPDATTTLTKVFCVGPNIIHIFKGVQSQRFDLEPESEVNGMLNANSSMKLIAENWIMLGWNSHKYWLSYLALIPKSRCTFFQINSLLC